MTRFQFTEIAWSEYMYWQSQDKKTLKRVNALLRDISRDQAESGLGKPEFLKGELVGYCSRRINEKDRIIYRRISDDVIEIYSVKGHYQDK